MKARQTIFKLMKVFLISGLYLSFFAVQLCFNFDLASAQINNSRTLSLQNKGARTQPHAFNQKSSISAKTNIRLNKRFEPKSFPYSFAPVIEIGFIYLLPKNLGHYYEQRFISHINLSTSLRGPPSIA
jgi:hypothetical protein